MIKSYLNIFFRLISNNRIYYFINLIGLTIGLLCLIFIMLWFDYESDIKHNDNSSYKLVKIGREQFENTQLYFINNNVQKRILFPESPFPLKKLLKEKCQEIKFIARFGYDGEKSIIFNSAVYKEQRFAFADPGIIKIFRFKYLKGNHQTAFSKPNSIIINKTTSDRFFLNEDPIGNEILLSDGSSFIVTAVIEDIPNHYKFQFDFLVNISYIESKYKNNWMYDIVNTYVLIDKDLKLIVLENKINKVTKTYKCKAFRVGNLPIISQYENILAYNDTFDNDPMHYIFSIIITFILLTSLINYANNSTVISSKRALEVGMRKVFGANKYQIILQHIVESLLLSFVCVIFAFSLTAMLLPYFNSTTGLILKINYSGNFFLSLIIITFISGLLAGAYPAFFMSGFKPINILKGDFRSGPKADIFRKIFVVCQFSVSVTLIVSSFVVFQQYELIENKKLANENEYTIDLRTDNVFKFNNLIKDLRENPKILKIKSFQNNLSITFISTEIPRTLSFIKKVWEENFPLKKFEYDFQDRTFNKIYKINDMKSTILYFFTLVIVFLSYIGLFANTGFMVKQKNSELAIRKAFGARLSDIQKILSGEYIKLVFISNIIAFFFVIWPMNTWFRRFSYRINLSYEAFLYTLIITIALTLLTIGYHSLRVWLTRPVKNLIRE